jgi:hypothetical protein
MFLKDPSHTNPTAKWQISLKNGKVVHEKVQLPCLLPSDNERHDIAENTVIVIYAEIIKVLIIYQKK